MAESAKADRAFDRRIVNDEGVRAAVSAFQLLSKEMKDAQEHLSKGKIKNAIDQMEDFMDRIRKADKKDYISDRAKAALVADAHAIIQSWSGNASDPEWR